MKRHPNRHAKVAMQVEPEVELSLWMAVVDDEDVALLVPERFIEQEVELVQQPHSCAFNRRKLVRGERRIESVRSRFQQPNGTVTRTASDV